MDLQGVIPYLVFIPLDAATVTDSELMCKSASRNSNSVLYGKAMASQFTSVDIFFNLHVIRPSNRIKTKKKIVLSTEPNPISILIITISQF